MVDSAGLMKKQLNNKIMMNLQYKLLNGGKIYGDIVISKELKDDLDFITETLVSEQMKLSMHYGMLLKIDCFAIEEPLDKYLKDTLILKYTLIKK